MKKEDKQQFTLRITQANSTQLVVILYEMLLCYLEDAAEALAEDKETKGEPDSFREAVRKARGCLNELIGSLHMQYEPAPALMQLYLFCIRRLALGEQRRDDGILDEVRKVIRPLCDSYRQLAELNSDGPVMRNSQTVYAGLTYGRNTLTENMADQGTNRGMLV
ncbi:flagellar export chaperone FliS [Acetatifactor aquisgranensis]|uniref:flagellar export chaperone FliS n=1 Tax=Acetatifactor aquisgranensis TaxID=2941233 RepID=UPI00203C1F72|nr:flagellar protein FliS [Acetatifactor aquisgranensis]